MGLLHHPFWLQLLWTLLGQHFQTDQGSVPEMRIYGPYCELNPDLKWCIHLSRSLFLYYQVEITRK